LQEWADEHKTLIILGVRDLSDLLQWEQKLRDAQLKYELFEEPDRAGEATAIAIHPAVDPYLFRQVRLL
jgi:peptidyl-tRNA hydrolase